MRVNLPITERERTFSNEQRLISTTDLDSRITYCNDAFVAISGFTYEELIGQTHNLVRHPDMPPIVFAHMWETIKQGKPWMGVVKNRSKNGDFYWVSAYVTAIYEDGRISGYESVRSLPSRAQIRRATALYARLRSGKAAISLGTRVLGTLQFGWPLLMLGGLSATSAVWLPQTAALTISGASLLSAWYLFESRQRKTIERILAEHPKAFTSPLVALTYSDNPGAQGQLEMAMISEEARLQTALTRLVDAGISVKSKAAHSSELSGSQAQSLERQRSETDRSAAAISQMSATIQEITHNVQNTAHAASEADRLAMQGSDLAQKSLVSMGNMSQAVNEIERAVATASRGEEISRDSMQSVEAVQSALVGISEAHEHMLWHALAVRIHCSPKRLDYVLGKGGSYIEYHRRCPPHVLFAHHASLLGGKVSMGYQAYWDDTLPVSVLLCSR
ncbi:hypothetical protein WR25_00645 [Diploscapter pachys]|uniref:PAS domain-containing protein n=1 Tax=Diploscapter pachys TaxID=2018661 RepID=A0A2A2JXG6_9BILA|nr:hypothetical protein WR25_00645 [Diploscapter pachys]